MKRPRKASWGKAARVLVMSAALVATYLAVARYSIHYRIRRAGLPVPDTKHAYSVGAGDRSLVYAALGDSLTSGVGVESYEQSFPYEVAAKLAARRAVRVELLTFSYPGATTSDVIADLLEPAIACKPDIVTVLVGTNDVDRDVGRDSFEANYRHILQRLAMGTSAKVYVIGLPKIGTNGLLLPPYNYYFARRARSFNETLRALAEEQHAELIELDAATSSWSTNTGAYYSKDSFHPSAAGYRLWAQAIDDAIAQARSH